MEKENLKCGQCQVPDGALHRLGCDMEVCPFCNGQLNSCPCSYAMLGLLNNKNPEEFGFLSQEVYENGLSDEQYETWSQMVEEKGRVPMEFPISRSKWAGRGESPRDILMRLLLLCYRSGKTHRLTPKNSPVTDYAPPVDIKNLGTIALYSRLFPPFPRLPGTETKDIFSAGYFKVAPTLQKAVNGEKRDQVVKVEVIAPKAKELDNLNTILNQIAAKLVAREPMELPEVGKFEVFHRVHVEGKHWGVRFIPFMDFGEALTTFIEKHVAPKKAKAKAKAKTKTKIKAKPSKKKANLKKSKPKTKAKKKAAKKRK